MDEHKARDEELLKIYPEIKEICVSSQDIQNKVKVLAAQISKDYEGKNVLLIGVLKGAFLFLSDLCKALNVPHEVDFVSLSSYGAKGRERTEIDFRMDLRQSIEDRDVLIVEDIIDSGHTLAMLQKVFGERKPRSIRTAVMCRKKECLQKEATIDYLGFVLPNEWLVGYGLDFKERMRCLPFIAALRRDIN